MNNKYKCPVCGNITGDGHTHTMSAVFLAESNSNLVEAVDAAYEKKLEEAKKELAKVQQALRAHIENPEFDHEPCPYCQQEKEITALRAQLETARAALEKK